MREPYPIGYLVADLHLSPRPPVARSAEKDWLEAQAGYLRQLREAARELPVFIAGDLFDKATPTPDVINLALTHLPHLCYAVPGQHDLPNHRYQDIKHSAYWTLVESKRLMNLEPGKPLEVPGRQPIRAWGFPFGFPAEPCKHPNDFLFELAVVHDYLWVKGKGYPGAPDDKRLKHRWKQFHGYDCVLVGDNHQAFEHAFLHDDQDAKPFAVTLWNNGCFMWRKRDEKGYRPRFGVLYSDGTVKPRYLDTSRDKWVEDSDLPEAADGIGYETLVEELASLGDSAINFSEAVHRLLEREKVDPKVKDIILRNLLKGGGK